MLDLPAAGIGARMYCNQEKKERVRGMTLRERAKTLKNKTAALFIALRRADTPFAAKLAAGLAVGYALSPIDLVPDFIPVLGYLDDVILLPSMIALAVRLIPADIMRQCRAQAKELWQDGKPKKWYYALPVAAFWAVLLLLAVQLIGEAVR